MIRCAFFWRAMSGTVGKQQCKWATCFITLEISVRVRDCSFVWFLIFQSQSSLFQDGVAVLDRENGFLVVNPDRLVRVTSIGDAVSCLRRSVWSEKLKAWVS